MHTLKASKQGTFHPIHSEKNHHFQKGKLSVRAPVQPSDGSDQDYPSKEKAQGKGGERGAYISAFRWSQGPRKGER